MSGRVKHRTSGPLRPGKRWQKIKPAKPVDLDWEQVAALRDAESHESNRLPVTGNCYDCGRPVTGERRFCGPCLAGHR